MLKRTKEDCKACRYFLDLHITAQMEFVLCGYGIGGTYRGYYKFMDGLVNCPQVITGTLAAGEQNE